MSGHKALSEAWHDPTRGLTQVRGVLEPVYLAFISFISSLLARSSAHVATVHARTSAFLQPHLDRVRAQHGNRFQGKLDQAVEAYSQHLHPRVAPVLASAEQNWKEACTRVDSSLAEYSKLEVALAAAALAVILYVALTWIRSVWTLSSKSSLKQRLLTAVKGLPGIKGYVQREMDKVLQTMRDDVKKLEVDSTVQLQLPPVGRNASHIIEELEARSANDYHYTDHLSQVTGTIYMTDHTHRELLHDAYCLFSQTNPLHVDLFPSIRKIEAEVVAMTASLLGGGPDGSPEVCGAMTSGGSESIVTAMFASLAYQRKHRGITQPEILMADSAHAAYYKAATYSGAKLVIVKADPVSFKLTAAAVRRRLTANTAVVITSAVTYPHGVLDDIAPIAALCRKRQVLLHVDACLGGFVLPFMRKLGHDVPPFDFSVPGVTSMSVDTHKYGQGHKGTSVVLYSSPVIRRCQYTSVTEWSGGMYISPGMAGSRSGALVATAWAALTHLGESGYVQATKETLDAALRFKACVERVPELAICGEPAMCLIAFRSRSRQFNVLVLSELMRARGWRFSALIKPPAVHFCFTHQHAGVAAAMCKDLLECCEEVRRKARAGEKADGRAKIYGMTNSVPDRQGLGDLLHAYQDIILTP